jgi:hypothetical protein
MDDVLILAPTRWKLREAIRVLNQTFSELRLEKHPDKTFIGHVDKGFDFLGYHFSPEGLSMAEKTIEKFLARAVRLYEREQGESFGSPRLGLYVRRWVRWVRGIAPRKRSSRVVMECILRRIFTGRRKISRLTTKGRIFVERCIRNLPCNSYCP